MALALLIAGVSVRHPVLDDSHLQQEGYRQLVAKNLGTSDSLQMDDRILGFIFRVYIICRNNPLFRDK